MPFGNAVGEGFINPGINVFIVGVPPNVLLKLASQAGAGFLEVIFNDPRFGNAGLAGDIQSNFAQVFLNGPGNTAAGHTDFVGIELNSSDGTSSANLAIIYTDTSGVAHNYLFVDSAGVHLAGPVQIDSAPSTLPLAHDANFPVSGAATLAQVITALNALYTDLVSGKIFTS